MNKPLNEDLFARFKEHLETIPTADQRAAYEAKQAALREKIAKLRSRMISTTRPAATRPADTRPAEAPGTAPAK